MADLYKTLGVGKDVSDKDLKAAYRKLAKKYHPDLNPKDESVKKKFQEITAAYELLSDPVKRGAYDRGEIDENGNPIAHHGFQGYRSSRSSSPFPDDFQFGGADFAAEDLFSSIFGRGRSRASPNRAKKGQDIAYTLKVTFIEAAKGAKRKITLSDGQTVELQIPAGTEQGHRLRLKGKGGAGANGGAAGDAFIDIHVAKSASMVRDGLDIKSTLSVTLPEAVLGATVDVDTIHGKVALKIPPGSSSGTLLRLKEKGIESRHGKGHHYVSLKICLPPAVDPDLKAFMEKWAVQHPYSVRN